MIPRRILAGLLSLIPAATATNGAGAASFACARAASALEHAICNDAALSARDERLAEAYRRALVRLGDTAGVLKDEQRDWLKETTSSLASGGVAAVKDRYAERIGQLEAIPRFPAADEPAAGPEIGPEIPITSPEGFALAIRPVGPCIDDDQPCHASAQLLVRARGSRAVTQLLNFPDIPLPCPAAAADVTACDPGAGVTLDDYNFDGRPDIAVANALPAEYRVGGAYVFLFDPVARRFVPNGALSRLTTALTFEVDAARKRILVGHKSGAFYHEEVAYRMDGSAVIPATRHVEDGTGDSGTMATSDFTWAGGRWVKTHAE